MNPSSNALLVSIDRITIEAERARRDLTLFVKEAWAVLEPSTRLLWNWHIDAIAQHLQAVYHGQILRLLVNIQPGTAKSTIFSVMWPVWCWTNDASIRWLCASHSLDLAIRDNKNCRDLITSQWYQERYGHLFHLKGDQNVKCVTASTLIMTMQGQIPIKQIVEERLPVQVLSYNQHAHKAEYKSIIGYDTFPVTDCVTVTCSNGAKITCTLNHPFYLPEKEQYREAQHLQVGDQVYASQLCGLRERILPGTIKGTAQQAPLLQHGVLRAGQASSQTAAILQDLWKPYTARPRQTTVLQSGLPESLSSRACLHSMQPGCPLQERRDQRPTTSILQSQVQRGMDKSPQGQQNITRVQGVWKSISGLSCPGAHEILFSHLLLCASSLEDTWKRASTLWKRLWNDVYQSAQPRWQPVYALSGHSAVGSPSYRPRQNEQLRNEFDNTVPTLPSAGNSCSATDPDGLERISIVSIERSLSQPVYNIEIQGNHSYFANGILTHNSFFENDQRGYRMAVSVGSKGIGKRGTHLLIDDPNDARDGDADIAATIDWFKKTWISRLNDQALGAMVVVGQRLHENDLSGHILSLGGWEHLNLPAEYEPQRRCFTKIGWSDPRTEEGELLWPERFPKVVLDKFKYDMGAMNYASQYQQTPVPSGGGQFKEKWFRYCSVEGDNYALETPEGIKHVPIKDCWRFSVVDLAISTRQSADYTVIQTYDVTPQNDLLLIDQVRGHFDNPEQQKLIRLTYLRLLPRFMQIEAVAYQLAIIQQIRDEPIDRGLVVPNPIEEGDFLVRVASPQALDQTLGQMKQGFSAFVVKDTSGVYASHNGYCAVRVQGDIYFFRFVMEHQGYGTIIRDVLPSDIQAIEQQARQKFSIPIREYKPVRDKVSRASAPALLMEQGRYYFLKTLSDLHVIKTEHLQFPKGANDDIVDCSSQAAEVIFVPSGPLMWSPGEVPTGAPSIETGPSQDRQYHLLQIEQPSVPANFREEGAWFDVDADAGRWS